MKPRSQFIKIGNNENLILKLLEELVLGPRVKALSWSKVTKQTPNMKIGYPGQHLASLITGVEGARTGARGDDLRDGTEVKTCSRVDQLDSCKACKQKVLRIENKCPHCGSSNIKRMDDSKWLFGIKSEEELNLLTKEIDRIFLTIADYPEFSSGDFDIIRFQAFEIWNNTERHKAFSMIMKNYYYKIFLEHIKINPRKTPAPKNFWPYSYQFYLCNPIKVFDAIVVNANTEPRSSINYYIQPDADRQILPPERMPTWLLNKAEVEMLAHTSAQGELDHLIVDGKKHSDLINISTAKSLNKKTLFQTIPYLDEAARANLGLRDTDKISEAKATYKRR